MGRLFLRIPFLTFPFKQSYFHLRLTAFYNSYHKHHCAIAPIIIFTNQSLIFANEQNCLLRDFTYPTKTGEQSFLFENN